MRKPVLVCVCGEQCCPGAEAETAELCCKGLLERREGLWRLLYEENAQTGERTRAELSFDGTHVSLTRRGAVRSEMHFAAGETSRAFYELPVGSLTMTVETDAVAAELDGDGGTLELRYRLTARGETVSKHRLLFRVVPRGEELDDGTCGQFCQSDNTAG